MFPLRVFACVKSKLSILVIPGLDPGIQGGRNFHLPLDCRVKPGNDEGAVLARLASGTRFTSRRDAVGGEADEEGEREEERHRELPFIEGHHDLHHEWGSV